MSSSRIAKRDRERAKQAKAVEKRERREIRKNEMATDDAAVPAASEADVLAALAALHTALEEERIDFDEFETTKAELLAQLQV